MYPFRTKIYADGANLDGMQELYRNPLISGFTTNPTLMRKAGVSDYQSFAQRVLAAIRDRPISFEVFSDDLAEMEVQAKLISSWGENVYVKIPITNTKGESCAELVESLSRAGVKLNVTAVLTLDQVREVIPGLAQGPESNISIFAGRIADSGHDPLPTMTQTLELLKPHPQIALLWASPREIFNLAQANEIGCHIITLTHDLIKKVPLLGKDLKTFSLETVKMFYDDACAAGYKI